MDAPYFACGRPAGDARRKPSGCVCELKQGHGNRSRSLREGCREEANGRGAGVWEKGRRPGTDAVSHSNGQLLQAQRDGDDGDGAGDCCGKLKARTRLSEDVRAQLNNIGRRAWNRGLWVLLCKVLAGGQGGRAVASVQEGIAADRDDLHEAVRQVGGRVQPTMDRAKSQSTLTMSGTFLTR